MNIQVLQQFLSSLRPPLQSIGASADVDALVAALAPYANWSVADFGNFLHAADGYRRSGQVAIPKPEDGPLKKLIESFASVRAGVQNGRPIADLQRQAAESLAEAGAALGVKVKTMIDAKWLAEQTSAARSAELATRLRTLAGRITGPESYAAPDLQSEIEYFDSLQTGDWKLLASIVPGNLPRQKKAVAALVKLTGHAVPAAPKKSKQPGFTPEELLPYVQRLKDRIERSNDRDTFPRAEVDAQIAELEPLEAAMIKAILKESNFALDGKATKPNMFKQLRKFLDAGNRAFERVQS